MRKWPVLILFILLSYQGLCQNFAVIDSVLKELQVRKPNEAIAEKALLIQYDKIINDLNKSLFIFESLYNAGVFANDAIKLGDLTEKLALVYYLKGNFTASFNLHSQSIKLFEKAGDLQRKAKALAAMAYEGKKRNLNSSIEMMAEAIQILKQIKAYGDLSSLYDNYGVLFEIKGDLDTALFYYREALKIKESVSDSVGLPYSLNNIAGILFMKNNISEGLKYINQSTEIREKLKDYVGMSWNEISLGEVYLTKNEIALAKQHFKKSLSLAQIASYPELKSRNLKYLSSIFAKQKQFDSAYIYFNSFFNINDSLYNDNARKQLVEMESLYNSEKKSLQIKTLDSDNQLKEKELEKKRSTQKFLIYILGLSLLAGILIFRAYRQKNAAGKIISRQKIEVEHQKQLIEDKQKEILDSIHYAERIQKSLMASEKQIEKTLDRLYKKEA